MSKLNTKAKAVLLLLLIFALTSAASIAIYTYVPAIVFASVTMGGCLLMVAYIWYLLLYEWFETRGKNE